ncbi:uroporphyrinogen-III synthase [Planctomyces sp. SH-PL62]|uniref:uroporphyrinogen-III synthase n=1 Tax=Planctomyces sp. SH-PL62 TaxID=1636152 RepID=UPI00078C8C9E|nr:uroporphyrinogen-III synthase [Planctomyces sp. SH-PL62]AMV36664.1 bifunctional uroporphyrinogen-III synthetase/response regulator domain protein [Planctomyces sp. SH-PL62]
MSSTHPKGLDGLRVAIFEARMAGSLADLVTRHGGVPIPAPALREIPLEDNPAALEFVEGLAAGAFDLVIFETGVGVRYLVEAVAPRFSREDLVAALRRTTVVARGPKPSTALRELGASIDMQVPAPNTWRETLALLDERRPVAGLRVAVQEYGKPVPELTEGLAGRGATVTRVPVYRWAMPEDVAPLRSALAELASGRIGSALFTAAQQVEHVVELARAEGIEDALREAFSRSVVVGSVGPTTSAALRAHGLPVDVEPEHPKSGHLVAAVAAAWRGIGKASSGSS